MWNGLPTEQRDGMKNYISDVIVQARIKFCVNYGKSLVIFLIK